MSQTFATDEIEIAISGVRSSMFHRTDGAIYTATITRLSGGRRSMSDVMGMLDRKHIPGIGTVRWVEMFCIDQSEGMQIGLYIKNG